MGGNCELSQAGKRKTFQPHDVDQIDPSLKLVRWKNKTAKKTTATPRG